LATIIVILNVACDQSTKNYARKYIKNQGTINVIDNFLSAGLIKLHMDTLLTGLTILATGGIAAIILFRRLGKYAEHRYGYELEMD